MEIFALRQTEGPVVRIKGELVVAHVLEANVRNGIGHNRHVTRWEIYQRKDDSWILYEQETVVGTDHFRGRVQDFPTLHALYESLNRRDHELAELLLDLFLSAPLGGLTRSPSA